MAPRRSLVWLALVSACGDPPQASPQCGDAIQVDGEVCLKVERKATTIGGSVFLQGDFNGDGKRDYYVDGEGFSSRHWILRERSSSWDVVHQDEFRDENDFEHIVYRASARDFDDDGFTDLLTLMHYEYASGDVETFAYGGVVLRAGPQYRFSDERDLFWEFDPEFPDDPQDRFDGAFADFDGDGATELLFAPNLRYAYVFRLQAGAPGGASFQLDQEIDLTPFAAQDNIVTVVADLDADGRDDLVLVDGLGRTWTLKSDAQGVLVPRTITEASVLPRMAGTVLARDVDHDGIVDLIGASTKFDTGVQLPGEFAIAVGDAEGKFVSAGVWSAAGGPTHQHMLGGPPVFYVHLALLDLDASGYPALVYALRDTRKLVIHPQVGRTLGAGTVELPLDLEPAGIFADPQDDGSVELLVSLWLDDGGTEDDPSDDRGPFIDRYRVDP